MEALVSSKPCHVHSENQRGWSRAKKSWLGIGDTEPTLQALRGDRGATEVEYRLGQHGPKTRLPVHRINLVHRWSWARVSRRWAGEKDWPGDWGDRASPRGSKAGDLRATPQNISRPALLPVTAIPIHRIISSRLINLNVNKLPSVLMQVPRAR
jgi:hypothetical protein